MFFFFQFFDPVTDVRFVTEVTKWQNISWTPNFFSNHFNGTAVLMSHISNTAIVWHFLHFFGTVTDVPLKEFEKKFGMSKRCSIILWLLSQWDICHRVKKLKKCHTITGFEKWDSGTAVPLKQFEKKLDYATSYNDKVVTICGACY